MPQNQLVDSNPEVSGQPTNSHGDLERSYTPVEISAESPALLQKAGATQGEPDDGQPKASIVVDNSIQYQTMEGFGASHGTLGSGPYHYHLSPEFLAQAIDAVYGQVRLTTGNLEIGPIETPANAKDPWAQQANDDDDPMHFNWQGFNFGRSDLAKQQLVDRAGPLGFDDYYLDLRISVRFANAWMKAIRAKDYNRYLDECGEQVSAGMIHWRDAYGIVPKYLELFNEPTSGNGELDPGSTKEEIDIVKRVGKRLRKEGFSSVKFVVPGEETEEKSLEVATAILADADARQYVGAIAYHPYSYSSTYCVIRNILNTAGRGRPDPEKVAVRNNLRALGKRHGLPLWMTEVSHGGVPAISFDGLLGRAIHIHDELVYADASAYFGMSNFDENTPRHGHAYDVFSDEGEIAIVDVFAKKVYITGMGYAIGHYARWIRRGAKRIEATSSDPLLLVAAFRDDAQNRLVLVVINNEDKTVRVRVQLKGFPGKTPITFTGEQSAAGRAWAPVVPLVSDAPDRIGILVPAKSVTTLVSSR